MKIPKNMVDIMNTARTAIRKGGLVVAGRQTGSQTAMMQVISEDYAGKAVIVCTPDEARFIREFYPKNFPDDSIPKTLRRVPTKSKLPVYVFSVMNNPVAAHDPLVKAAILPIGYDNRPIHIVRRKCQFSTH